MAEVPMAFAERVIHMLDLYLGGPSKIEAWRMRLAISGARHLCPEHGCRSGVGNRCFICGEKMHDV